jgi:hypothetical protein
MVKTGATVGVVDQIAMRATRTITRDGVAIIVPNSALMRSASRSATSTSRATLRPTCLSPGPPPIEGKSARRREDWSITWRPPKGDPRMITTIVVALDDTAMAPYVLAAAGELARLQILQRRPLMILRAAPAP